MITTQVYGALEKHDIYMGTLAGVSFKCHEPRASP